MNDLATLLKTSHILAGKQIFGDEVLRFRLSGIMRASDDEIEASVTLNQLAGRPKHDLPLSYEDVSTQSESETTSTYPDFPEKSSLDAPPAPKRERTPQFSARQNMTKKSLQDITTRLSSLTMKNQEIKASIQALRKTCIDDLWGHMKIRGIAISQLGRKDLEDDMVQLCKTCLWSRKDDLVAKQKELTTLEELLGGHKAVLDFADLAFTELKEKIFRLEHELTTEECNQICQDDYPAMNALARLTGGVSAPISVPPDYQKWDLSCSRIRFPQFLRLPLEIRRMIWLETLPDARIITHHSRHNEGYAVLGVCKEARTTVLTRLERVLSPTFDTDKTDTRIIHANADSDTIIRDLCNPGGIDPFDLEIPSFNSVCFRLFIGLVKVKHLAIAFDLVHNNGGQLFTPVQACCPDLESLTLFPTSQLEGGPLKIPKQATGAKVKFLEIDANVIDHVYHRWQSIPDHTSRRKAFRGISILLTLYDHCKQYHAVFPQYLEQHGQKWAPTITVALMMNWNEKCKGWHSRTLDGDKYSKGFLGEDGRRYRGFLECGMMAGEDGVLYSRYDGLTRMFGDMEI